MKDQRQQALVAVRMVRERIEEREERALGEVSRDVQRAREIAERLHEELDAMREAAAKSLHVLSSGLEIRQRAAGIAALQRQRVAAVEELEQLKVRHTGQMHSYRVAHAGRKAIEELQEQRRAAHVAALLGRERKSDEELFLGRRMSVRQRVEQEMREQ